MANHTRVWEEAAPVGTEDVSLGDDRIRNLKVDLGERLEDLLYGFNISDGTGDEATPGIKALNFKEQSSIATPSANQINIAAQEGVDGDAKAQLWAEDEDGNERQLTITSDESLRLNIKAGDYPADSIDEDDIQLGKNSYLKGLNNAGDGEIDLIKADSDDKACLSDGAVLAAATEAGDGDRTIADKKFVVDQIAAAFPDDDAYGDWASKSNNTAYEAESDGEVHAICTSYSTALKGYTDGNNPPTTMRQGIAGITAASHTEALTSIKFSVKKGNYWKVTGANTVCWLPNGG